MTKEALFRFRTDLCNLESQTQRAGRAGVSIFKRRRKIIFNFSSSTRYFACQMQVQAIFFLPPPLPPNAYGAFAAAAAGSQRRFRVLNRCNCGQRRLPADVVFRAKGPTSVLFFANKLFISLSLLTKGNGNRLEPLDRQARVAAGEIFFLMAPRTPQLCGISE